MAHFFVTALAILLFRLQSVYAQFPPTPKYDKVVESKVHPGVKISYKTPGICETTPGVKSFSGYIHLPIGSLANLDVSNDYPINLFFWFFGARKDPVNAPLALWLNGGPGSSSMKGLFHGTGPCYVNADSKTTTLNPWSWNNEANMLYVDQPVQTGFSYDVLVNITLSIMEGEGTIRPNQPIPEQSSGLLVGTGASRNAFQTANTTGTAARATWRFLQAFVGEFPEYKSKNSSLSIWSTGYGGRFAPSFAAYFLQQSQKREANTIPLRISTVGIVNGLVDMAVQQLKFPLYAFNNTYGVQAIDEGIYRGVTNRYNLEDGCGSVLPQCRALAAKSDPKGLGIGGYDAINLCSHAVNVCSTVYGGYQLVSSRNTADITHKNPDPFPPAHYVGYLNSRIVQEALGVPRNFTPENYQVNVAFDPYDSVLGGHLENIGYVLDQGVTVALVYGDRDYSNNWLGGEALSTAITFRDTAAFKSSGYQDLKVNTSYTGGSVRQVGKLSFTRVYDAGQEAFAYQPETLYQIFNRALKGKDIATGSNSALDSSYKTVGAASTWSHKNKVPCPPKQECYVLARATCTNLQQDAIARGYGVIKDNILTGFTPNVPSYLDPPYLKNQPKPAGC